MITEALEAMPREGTPLNLLERAQEVGQLLASIDLKLLCLIILGATHWVTQWYDPDGTRRADEIAETHVDVILNGAAPRA